MGRPREHDERTAVSLLAAAERIVEDDGPDALSVRRVAEAVGTTTRAVYSLYGSKDGLIAALAGHGFDLLRCGISRLPETSEPARELVEAGLVFRRYAVEHPSLFRITFQRDPSPMRTSVSARAAGTAALEVLKRRIVRLEKAGLLGQHDVDAATLSFHAVCEGLAGLELRGNLATGNPEGHWRRSLSALVAGLMYAAD